MSSPLFPNVEPLRQRIRRWIEQKIIVGDLPPGSRIRDTAIAEELGVSRTPVRETLVGLAREGLVKAEPNRGFSVASLIREEVEQVYPIIWTLETFALSSAPGFETSWVRSLREINRAFSSMDNDTFQFQELDLKWHETLVSVCANRILINSLTSLKSIARRYECAIYMQDLSWVNESAKEHSEILEAIAQKKIKPACHLLERHWKRGQQNVLSRLDEVAPQ